MTPIPLNLGVTKVETDTDRSDGAHAVVTAKGTYDVNTRPSSPPVWHRVALVWTCPLDAAPTVGSNVRLLLEPPA